MELNAKFRQLGTMTEGNSSRGQWKKQDFIVETLENQETICVTAWNDDVDRIQSLAAGQLVSLNISVKSREFNGKWYTDVRFIRFNGQQTAQQPQQPQMAAMPQPLPQPTYQHPVQQVLNEQPTGDDLPF